MDTESIVISDAIEVPEVLAIEREMPWVTLSIFQASFVKARVIYLVKSWLKASCVSAAPAVMFMFRTPVTSLLTITSADVAS